VDLRLGQLISARTCALFSNQLVLSGVRLRSTRIDAAAHSLLCFDFVYLRRINP
jgi:hypothetical protein